MGRPKKKVVPQVVEQVIIPYIPQTPVEDSYKQFVFNEAVEQWNALALKYGHDVEMPDNVQKRHQEILEAPDLEMTIEASRRAKNTSEIMVFGAWAQGRIDGPITERSIEKQAKSAESLASMLHKKGNTEAAERQLLRADKLWEQLDKMVRGVL